MRGWSSWWVLFAALCFIWPFAKARWAVRRECAAGFMADLMLARKARMLVAVALANRMARIAWALMKEQTSLQVACTGNLSGRWASSAGRNVSRAEDNVGASGHRDGIGKTGTRTESFQARVTDMDPVRASPYGPAASETPQSRGLTYDCT